LTGLASASSLFLVASGLSLIFGVSRIVNFAHGSFYMLGAYTAYSLVEAFGRAGWGFWAGVLAAAAIVGLLGLMIERLLIRRIYNAPELFPLLATFGLTLIIQDVALLIWGPDDLLGPRAYGLGGVVEIAGQTVPSYDLFLAVTGPAVLAGLWLGLHRTRLGVLVRAATEDREMVSALGVDERRLHALVFAAGAFLAGLGGALQLPREAANLHMDLNVIVEAFVVVVLGGMGSIAGAYLAALLIGELQAFGIALFPRLTLVLIFLVMAAVLLVRPRGLLGRREDHAPPPGASLPSLGAPTGRGGAWALASLALLAAAPLLGQAYLLTVLVDMLVFALFAQSLQLLMGRAGIVSFGHAAYLGIGAYAAALAVKYLAAPMAIGLALAPLAAGFAGMLFGLLCGRLAGVYLAMLSLAYAQIAWSIAVQWLEVTGGDNGILGVWPDEWARGHVASYYVTLALAGAGIWLLLRIARAPFGVALQAARDSRRRAEAIGIDVAALHRVTFVLAAAFAGLAGGLFAYAKGSVFPTYIAIQKSVDALVMVLLGGIHSLAGPAIGAALYVGLFDQLGRATEYWRLAIGTTIVALVVLFPGGVAGAARLVRRPRPDRGAGG